MCSYFHHYAIAGDQRVDHRTDGEIQRIVPRHDDADHAKRLRPQLGERRQELQRRRDALRRHPVLQVFCGVPDLAENTSIVSAMVVSTAERWPKSAEIACRKRSSLSATTARSRASRSSRSAQVRRRLGPRPRDHGLEGCPSSAASGALVKDWSNVLFHGITLKRRSPILVAASWRFVDYRKCVANRPESVPVTCHKVEKNVPTALSKGSTGWYIPPAPNGLYPGVAFQGSLRDGRSKPRAPRRPTIHRPRHFDEGKQRLTRGGAAR